MCSPAAADSYQPGRRGRRDWSPPRSGPTPADPPPSRPGYDGGVPPARGKWAWPWLRSPALPPPWLALPPHPRCSTARLALPASLSAWPHAAPTRSMPGGPPPLTEPVSLFSLSTLPLSLRTHALRLPGLATAPQGGCPGFEGSAGPDPSCSFPFSLGSQSHLCDFPVAWDLRICSSTPLASYYPSPTSCSFCKSLVDVAKVFCVWRHPGCWCLRFCWKERRATLSECVTTFPLLDLVWSGLRVHQARNPRPRTEMALPIKGHFGHSSAWTNWPSDPLHSGCAGWSEWFWYPLS